MDSQSHELQVAIDTAKKAAEIELRYYKIEEAELEITYKEDESVLTRADGEVEKMVKQNILNEFPDAEFITEENENTTKNFNSVWIIDPIDGTREFSRGLDLWSILIAHAVSKEITLGVCYFPALDIMIYAEKGKGAFVNGERVNVTKTDSISKAFLGYSPIKYYSQQERDVLLSVVGKVGSSRSFSSSYSGYCIGAGKLDAFIASGHNKIWDTAPFVPIVKEAGGMVTDWSGKELDIENDTVQVVISNGLVHAEILKMLDKNGMVGQ